MANKLLLLTVFLIPLIGPVATFGFEQAKVIFFIFGTSLAAIFWLFSKDRHRFKWTPILKISGLFILVLFITSVFGTNLQNSIIGVEPYFQGWILYAYLWLFLVMVSNLRIKVATISVVLISSATLVSIIAIKDWIFLYLLNQPVSTYADRVVSTFGQPNFYAGFILLSLPFLIPLHKTLKGFWVLDLLLILTTAVVVSGSRIAILLEAGMLLYWLASKLSSKKIVVPVLSLLVFGIITISGVTSSGLIWKEFQEPVNTKWLIDNSPEKRIFIWPVIIGLIKERPLLGYGLETMQQNFSIYFSKIDFNAVKNPVFYSLRDLKVDRAHNYILDLLFFSGIMGFVTWASLVFLLARKLIHLSHGRSISVLMVALTTYLVWVQFQNQSVVHLMYFWLLVGLIDQKVQTST